MADKPLLEVKDLVIHYETDNGVVKALNGVNIHIGVGETLGLVGETGAGKTTLAKGIMRLIPNPPGKILGGEFMFEGQDLLKLTTNGMEAIRGRDISMIFQDPMTSLNPVLTVGWQIMEVIENHNTSLSRQEARKWAENMLERVGIPAERFGEYPHQFSGGMKQRVALLRALACDPRILLMDEPLGAVDFQMRQLLQVQLESILQQKKVTSLMVTHDVDESVYLSDRVIVMSRDHGKIMEDLKIDLPRPRNRTAPKYHEYVDELTNILKTALNGAVYTQEDKDIMEFIHRTEEIEEGVAERLKKG